MARKHRRVDKDNFAIPDTPAPRRPQRDIAAQFQQEYGGDMDKFRAETESFNRVHLRPLAPNTLRKHADCKRMWLAYFTLALQSKDAAEAMLVRDAPPPPLDLFKQYVYFCAKLGKSGIDRTRTGWTIHTARNFVRRTIGMRNRLGCKLFAREDITQVYNALLVWAKVDKVISTDRRQRRIIRQSDFAEFLQAALDDKVHLATNLMRMQLCTFTSFLWYTGQRPGAILESNDYKGQNQFLKWGHVELIYSHYEHGLGASFSMFTNMHYMKNMRDIAGDYVHIYLKTMPREFMHLDPVLMFLALGLHSDVFETDVYQFLDVDPSKIPQGPIILKVRDDFKDKPIFVDATGEGPWTMHGAQKMFKKVTIYIVWEFATFYSFRYGFAAQMAAVMPKYHLRYFMGQKKGIAYTTYQVPERSIDMAAMRTGTTEDTDMADLRRSVAWKRVTNAEEAEEASKKELEEMMKNPTLALAADMLWHLGDQVHDKYAMFKDEIPDDYYDDPLVVEYMEALSSFVSHYQSVRMQGSRKHSTAHVQRVINNNRGRSTSVASSSSSRDASVDPAVRFRERSLSATSQASSSLQVASRASSGSRGESLAPTESARGRSQSVTSDRSMRSVSSRGRSAPPPRRGVPQVASTLTSIVASLAPENISEEVREELLGVCETIQDNHPFQHLVENDAHQPRSTILSHILALLHSDKLHKDGICVFCYANGKHKASTYDHYSDHAWTCEAQNRPDEWRCSVCTHFITIPDKDEMPADELDATITEFDAHCEACYKTLLEASNVEVPDLPPSPPSFKEEKGKKKRSSKKKSSKKKKSAKRDDSSEDSASDDPVMKDFVVADDASVESASDDDPMELPEEANPHSSQRRSRRAVPRVTYTLQDYGLDEPSDDYINENSTNDDDDDDHGSVEEVPAPRKRTTKHSTKQSTTTGISDNVSQPASPAHKRRKVVAAPAPAPAPSSAATPATPAPVRSRRKQRAHNKAVARDSPLLVPPPAMSAAPSTASAPTPMRQAKGKQRAQSKAVTGPPPATSAAPSAAAPASRSKGKQKAQNEADADSEDEKTKAPPKKGLLRLSIASRIANSGRPLCRIFCAICLFDAELPWQQRLDSRRSAATALIHLYSHYTGAESRTRINYDKTHTCHISPCRGDVTFNTGAHITHLDVVHGFNLVQCSRPHTRHSPACDRTLTGDFRFITDALLDESLLGIPIPAVSLRDTRRKRDKDTSARLITEEAARKRAGPSATTEVAEAIAEGEAVTDGEVAEHAYADNEALSATVAPLAAAVSAAPGTLSLPRPCTLDEFCMRYQVSDRDKNRLQDLEFEPGDLLVLSLGQDEWGSVGFKTLSWNRFIKAYELFIEDVESGAWC